MNKPIFDDWAEVNPCNKCESYWNSTCDGKKKLVSENTPQTKNKPFCGAFTPTREGLIGKQLKVAQKGLNLLSWCVCVLGGLLLLHIVGHIFNWW